MDISRRIERLQQLRGMTTRPSDFIDPQAELIRRVNAIAERAEALGEIPPISEAEQAQFLANFRNFVRRKYGNY
jgi:hypothetical protein